MWSRGSSRCCCRNCSNPGLNKQFLRDGFYWKLWNHQDENMVPISHYTLTHRGFVVFFSPFLVCALTMKVSTPHCSCIYGFLTAYVRGVE